MNGMDAATGRAIVGDAHLAQSIRDILTTPIGTRVMRRDYGSTLFDLIDAPVNALTRLRVFAATALAIARWEPRIALSRVDFAAGSTPERPVLTIEGRRTDDADSGLAALTIPLRPSA